MNKTYAVLIDAENVSTKYLQTIFEELNKFGSTPIRRAYADFSKTETKKWNDACHKYSITLVHKSSSSAGKNSTDASMIINAMDLLYRESYIDGFVIITNDSDFTSLCQRIRESGKEVIGMSEQANKTEMFKNACTIFRYLEVIDNSEKGIKPKADFSKIEKSIIEILSREEKTLLSALKEILVKKYPEFDERTYGKKKFSDLIKNIDGIVIEAGDNGLTHWVSYNENNREKSINNVKATITKILKDNKGQLNIGDLNARLQKLDIKYKDYGHGTPTKFFNSLEEFSIKGEYIDLIR